MPSNKNVFKILLLIIYLNLTISSNRKKKSFKDIVNQYLGKLDIKNAYLSYDQYISLLNRLVKDFPNYLELSSIGKTYEGNDMPLIIMKSPLLKEENNSIQSNNTINDKDKISNNDINKKDSSLYNKNGKNYEENENYLIPNFKEDNNKTQSNSTISDKDKINNIDKNKIDSSLHNQSGILFTGMHHGREPVSMMMNIYLILHLLSLPRTYLHLFLSATNIYFIPIINIDTYKYNSKKFLSGSPLRSIMARKNRKPHSTKRCSTEDIGVDLNRNYDYFFAKDNTGSSGNPCQEDYRGEHPFSEPETINIKNFVDSHPNIKITYNYHSWGNLIITPFNYLKNEESLKKLQKDFPIQYNMYNDFKKEGEFPQNFLFGNADKTIQYLTNGDATDWFLGKKKILSFSPELGNGKKESDVFYPDRTITFDILEKNLYGGLYAIQKSMYYLTGELISATYNECYNKNKYSLSDIYFNKGRLHQYKNLKEYELKNCFSGELLLNVKVKITNKGFGDYSPGVEFPNFQQVINNNETVTIENKKYLYFLSFDLNVDINKIKSICYWNTLKTLYTIETNDNDIENINKTQNEPEETQYIGTIRCENVNKGNDITLFIDDEIKSLDFIILNIKIIVKKDNFIEKLNIINKNRFLDLNLKNSTNLNNKYNENKEIIKIYTKNDRIIKSEKENGEIIYWKFNNPSIGIKVKDFIESKNKINYDFKRINIFKLLIIIICIILLMIFFIYRMIKTINGRPFNELLMESRNNENVVNNNNIDINISMNNEQIVNNLENANQNENISNENIVPFQIPRDENEAHYNNNSNSNSPNQLNA